jgi:hypothetical protein
MITWTLASCGSSEPSTAGHLNLRQATLTVCARRGSDPLLAPRRRLAGSPGRHDAEGNARRSSVVGPCFRRRPVADWPGGRDSTTENGDPLPAGAQRSAGPWLVGFDETRPRRPLGGLRPTEPTSWRARHGANWHRSVGRRRDTRSGRSACSSRPKSAIPPSTWARGGRHRLARDPFADRQSAMSVGSSSTI